MMWYLISVFGFLSFPIAFTVIVEGPKNSVLPEGSNVTLTCLANLENTVVWEDINENTVIFIRKEKNTMKEKFDNFFISDAERNYSLTIVNAQVSDDGFYSCEEGDERRNANLTVEAGPHLSIFVNDSEPVFGKRRTLSENEEASVRCRAVGAKPAVHLQLKFGDKDWVTTSDTITNDGLLFTTEIMVVHRFVRNDTTITCQATGQVSISPTTSVISMDILHKPACLIELKEDMAECKCNSNPPVSSHKWYINGELKSTGRSLSIRDYLPANIACSAVNAIGTAPLSSRYVSLQEIQGETPTKRPILVFVVIILAALFVIVMAVLIIIRLKQSGMGDRCFSDAEENYFDAEDATPNTEENIRLARNNDKVDEDNEGSSVYNIVRRSPVASNERAVEDKEENVADKIDERSLTTNSEEAADDKEENVADKIDERSPLTTHSEEAADDNKSSAVDKAVNRSPSINEEEFFDASDTIQGNMEVTCSSADSEKELNDTDPDGSPV